MSHGVRPLQTGRQWHTASQRNAKYCLHILQCDGSVAHCSVMAQWHTAVWWLSGTLQCDGSVAHCRDSFSKFLLENNAAWSTGENCVLRSFNFVFFTILGWYRAYRCASFNDRDTLREMRRYEISSLCERHTLYSHKPTQYSIPHYTPHTVLTQTHTVQYTPLHTTHCIHTNPHSTV
jgi:hypothetical protein